MSEEIKKALAAKVKLRIRLRAAGIQASCGVSKVGERLVLKVNLPSSADQEVIQRSVVGIRLVHEQVGQVKSMTP